MPVSSGRWLRSSENASRPPAEAPTPTTMAHSSADDSTAVATAETGLTAEVGVFPFAEARRECLTSPGRGLPVFFATRHHAFLAGRSVARVVPFSPVAAGGQPTDRL